MARTHNKHVRLYVDGYDLSGVSRQVGAMDWDFEVTPDAAMTDGSKNIVLGQASIMLGPLNAFLENDAANLFALAAVTRGTRDVTVAIGANAAPAAGDPVFSWTFEDKGYMAHPAGAGFVGATLPLEVSYASNLGYKKPWGFLLHPKGAETAVNTATGLDDNAGSSALGGLFIYHIFSADGTATVKAQDAATNANGSFADLSGATSGVVDASVTPKHGIISLATSATIRRYTRWQIVLGTATTVTFAAALIRNNIS